jgi:hypothetical protein
MASKKNIDIALQKIGEKLVQGFISEIRNANKVSTGALTNPSNWDIEVSDGRLLITTLPYAGTVDQGRGPTMQDDGGALRSALLEWVFQKNITLSQSGATKGRKTGQFFKKGTIGLPSSKTKSVVFAMARKIHQGGYGQRYGVAEFTDKTFTKYADYISNTISEEYVSYIKESVDETITNYLRNQ